MEIAMQDHMNAQNLRYIVFLLNPGYQYMSDGRKADCHDGFIFCSLQDAQEYAQEAIRSHEATRFVIGTFVWEQGRVMLSISCVETYGFKGDRKPITQLSLFPHTSKP
jgi:hypothetical protein